MSATGKLADVSRLQTAASLLQAGRAAEARALLVPLVQADPRGPDARHLLGLALEATGDLAGAEAETRAALALDKKKPPYHAALGDILLKQARSAEAERAYRAALALDRRYAPAAVSLGTLLQNSGRATEAAQVTAPLAALPTASADVLAAHASALKMAGRLDEAILAAERAAKADPSGAVREHNLAAMLGDASRFQEALDATGRAFAKGLDAPETWLVRGRALQGLNRLDEAEAAFREAIRRRPSYPDPHRDLSQLVWMRTEDSAAATAALDQALQMYPQSAALALHKAKLFEYAGEPQKSYDALRAGLARNPNDFALHILAAHVAILAEEPQAALGHADRAAAIRPADQTAQLLICETALAVGDPARVVSVVEKLRTATPLDQYVLALQATAWRLLGDARYQDLYDYDAFVRPWTIDTPPGWSSLDAYLADLAVALQGEHPFRTHPLDQSLRHGSQASHIARSEDPAIRAFFKAIDGPIRRHIAALGKGKDPLRSRIQGGYAFNGIWSVRLRPNGHHVDHVHPQGWLSSACYIALPKAVQGEGREGWIKFGEPGVRTRPPLPPEHFVKPEPGQLVLFPSYMWHGTVPFTGDDSRLTIAFDLLPAR